MSVDTILEWMYPYNMDIQTLDWQRLAIWNWLWRAGSYVEANHAINALYPQACDVSQLTGRVRELHEARREHIERERQGLSTIHHIHVRSPRRLAA